MGKTYTNHKGVKAATPTTKGQSMFKDSQCKGLYLRVYANGKKVFIHRFWVKGKERLVKLEGLELTAESKEREISDGTDPALERDLKAHKINTMPTVQAFPAFLCLVGSTGGRIPAEFPANAKKRLNSL